MIHNWNKPCYDIHSNALRSPAQIDYLTNLHLEWHLLLRTSILLLLVHNLPLLLLDSKVPCKRFHFWPQVQLLIMQIDLQDVDLSMAIWLRIKYHITNEKFYLPIQPISSSLLSPQSSFPSHMKYEGKHLFVELQMKALFGHPNPTGNEVYHFDYSWCFKLSMYMVRKK